MSSAPDYRAEISRKVLHLTAAITPFVYMCVSRDTMIRLIAPCVLLAMTIELLRFASPGFHAFFRRWVGFMVRQAEWDRITGATYVMIGALLSVWWFPKPVAIAAMLIQIVSDTAASLIGIRYGRTRFLGKSLAGSGAFFITAVIILVIAMPDSKEIALAAALVATLAEALPALRLSKFELNDNVTVPLLTGITIWLLRDGPAWVPLTLP
jgi:dolichol kinase